MVLLNILNCDNSGCAEVAKHPNYYCKGLQMVFTSKRPSPTPPSMLVATIIFASLVSIIVAIIVCFTTADKLCYIDSALQYYYSRFCKKAVLRNFSVQNIQSKVCFESFFLENVKFSSSNRAIVMLQFSLQHASQ